MSFFIAISIITIVVIIVFFFLDFFIFFLFWGASLTDPCLQSLDTKNLWAAAGVNRIALSTPKD